MLEIEVTLLHKDQSVVSVDDPSAILILFFCFSQPPRRIYWTQRRVHTEPSPHSDTKTFFLCEHHNTHPHFMAQSEMDSASLTMFHLQPILWCRCWMLLSVRSHDVFCLVEISITHKSLSVAGKDWKKTTLQKKQSHIVRRMMHANPPPKWKTSPLAYAADRDRLLARKVEAMEETSFADSMDRKNLDTKVAQPMCFIWEKVDGKMRNPTAKTL